MRGARHHRWHHRLLTVRCPPGGILKKSATARGIFVGSRADFVHMNEFIARHRLHPLVDRVYPIEQYFRRCKRWRQDSFMGKIVLTF